MTMNNFNKIFSKLWPLFSSAFPMCRLVADLNLFPCIVLRPLSTSIQVGGREGGGGQGRLYLGYNLRHPVLQGYTTSSNPTAYFCICP